jgi:hypothetical protein
MGYISASTGAYYEGDQASPFDTIVPQRPGATYVFQDGAWVQDQDLVDALKPKPSPLDWFTRISSATQAGLSVAARTDAAVDLALRYVSGVDFIDVADPRTVANVTLLRSKDLLTDDEAAILLAP